MVAKPYSKHPRAAGESFYMNETVMGAILSHATYLGGGIRLSFGPR